MPRVLISDNLEEAGRIMFQQAKGIDMDYKPGLSPDEFKNIIKDYDALIIRSATKVTKDVIEAAPNLKVIGRAGIGLDNVDVQAATKRGIVVENTPEGNVVTTAEHAISLMLSLSRKIPQATASLKDGRWEKKGLTGREIFNKTLGVIGYGRIGSIVADRAKGLKMDVIVHDPFTNQEILDKAGLELVSIEDLFARSDYITVHVPKTKNTIGLLNKNAFSQMKDKVMIINCARGGIVNEADLYEALKSGKVAGAALDVFETEPPGKCPLLELDNVIATPHLGASTTEAQTNVAVAVVRQIIDYLSSGTVMNAVNVPSVAGDLLKRLKPYLDLGERMGSLHCQLAEGPIQQLSIEYAGDFSGLDISPITISILKGLLTPMVKEAVNFVNAPMLAKERGIKVVESRSNEFESYTHLITITATSQDGINRIAGTIFGKEHPRIVRINSSYIDLIPEGHILLVNNEDKPGAIGSMGTVLGSHGINIGRMHVGQDTDGGRNVIILVTDSPAPDEVIRELQLIPMIKSVKQLEL
ncbi:MAG: phosphoglycerate dehydrogenase [Pseudomonadota bacterium]